MYAIAGESVAERGGRPWLIFVLGTRAVYSWAIPFVRRRGLGIRLRQLAS